MWKTNFPAVQYIYLVFSTCYFVFLNNKLNVAIYASKDANFTLDISDILNKSRS